MRRFWKSADDSLAGKHPAISECPLEKEYDMPFHLKIGTRRVDNKQKTEKNLSEDEFESFFGLAEVARDNNLSENGIIALYHKMSKAKNDEMSLEHAENYIRALESINGTAGGGGKVYFQGDSEKRSPLAHYNMTGGSTTTLSKGYYRFVPSDKNKVFSAGSRINISVHTNKLILLSQIISDLTLKEKNIIQSKIVSPGAIENITESAVIYLKGADLYFAEIIAKSIYDKIGADSLLPTKMIGLKMLQTGIGYKEVSKGDTTSAARSLAKVIGSAISSQPYSKLKSEKNLRKELKAALERRGYERKNPALRIT